MRIYCIEDKGTFAMEDNSAQLSHQNSGNVSLGGIGGTSSSSVNNKPDDGNSGGGQPITVQQYTIPGILHFIQHEWTRFELERSQWDVDRAELKARIGVLLGERRGQESLKSDLIRRIKMLEYALKQERIKFHRLKYGCDPPNMTDIKPPTEETGIGSEVAPDSEVPFSAVSNITWRQGRQILRQYLQEIGYTDTIIDVRSNRVRSLLGLNNNAEQEENVNPNVNGNETNKRAATDNQGRRPPAKKTQQTAMTEAMIMDSEDAVTANFAFLSETGVDMSDDDEMSDDIDIVGDNEDAEMRTAKHKIKDSAAEAEEVLNELNLRGDDDKTVIRLGHDVDRRSILSAVHDDEAVDSSLGLGDLAQLTVNNDAETYDVSNTKEVYRKAWSAKYALRSHFDGVRGLAFHPENPVLITASEDHTLKLWNLQKTIPAKKSASLDVEPLYTFRAHTGPVLCLTINNMNECYSGGLDGAIHCWDIPGPNIDPYDSYDPRVLLKSLEGHSDAVWGLSWQPDTNQLASCSADGTVKLWSPHAATPLLNTFTADPEDIPCSVDFVRDGCDRIVVAYNSKCIIYDIQTGKPVVKLEVNQDGTNGTGKFINKVISHPTLSTVVTAHEDRHIRFWDANTGELKHSMVAHLEPVTSLAMDSHGLYLLSGSHDCSIRLWSTETYTCVQEITAHRKKFDESIFDVAFHPSRPYIASAGADGLAKVFV